MAHLWLIESRKVKQLLLWLSLSQRVKRNESEGGFHILVTAGTRRVAGGGRAGPGGGAVPRLRHEPERLVLRAGRRSLRAPPQRRCLPGRPGVLRHALSRRVGGGVPARRSRLRLKLPDRRLHEHTAAAGGAVAAAACGLDLTKPRPPYVP